MCERKRGMYLTLEMGKSAIGFRHRQLMGVFYREFNNYSEKDEEHQLSDDLGKEICDVERVGDVARAVDVANGGTNYDLEDEIILADATPKGKKGELEHTEEGRVPRSSVAIAEGVTNSESEDDVILVYSTPKTKRKSQKHTEED